MNNTITRDKFMQYEEVRESGETNMFDVRMVMDLSDDLTKPEIIEIMTSYKDLKEKYGE